MFARILAHQEEASRKADQILAQVQRTNGRVTSLEQWRTGLKAKLGLVAAAVSAVIALLVPVVEKLLNKFL